jgi:integrase
MIELLERGRLEMPPETDPGTFIVSDGKLRKRADKPQIKTLNDLFTRYVAELPTGAKEESTRDGEDIHMKHLKRHLKAGRNVHTLSSADIQAYIAQRSKDLWHGKQIRPETIKKEVTTFRLIWNWAKDRSYLKSLAPTKGLKYPKQDEKSPFMTWQEIEKIVVRGVSEDEEKALWKCLFLDRQRISQVLDYVKENNQNPMILPMFCFAAQTGARRSEILRSQIEDFDFDGRIVKIREKKKSKSKNTTFRYVGLTDRLAQVMSDWLAAHPGGRHVICDPTTDHVGEMNCNAAHRHFKRALVASKWEKICGFHVFRHSFASNAALAGVGQGEIDEWLGHTTEEMRRRYRHLFPEQRSRAIELVFSGNGQ